jgi:hypothetical protein
VHSAAAAFDFMGTKAKCAKLTRRRELSRLSSSFRKALRRWSVGATVDESGTDAVKSDSGSAPAVPPNSTNLKISQARSSQARISQG